MVNYKNAKIYKLVNDSLGLTYYGSTCGQLRSRLCAHKSDAKTMNLTSKLLFEQGICKIFLVEEYPTDNKMLLLQRERWYIENNECVNKCLPGRTKKEWEVDNHNKRAKQKKEYYVDNRVKIEEQKRVYRANNKEKIKEQMKEYQIKNRDKINQQQKIRRARIKLEKSLKTN
jgi:hypothetical protein